MAVVFVCKKCLRRSCQFYNKNRRNNCEALSEVYGDSNKCPFYKPYEEEVKPNGSKR